MMAITCYQVKKERVYKEFVFKENIGSDKVEIIELDTQCLKSLATFSHGGEEAPDQTEENGICSLIGETIFRHCP